MILLMVDVGITIVAAATVIAMMLRLSPQMMSVMNNSVIGFWV